MREKHDDGVHIGDFGISEYKSGVPLSFVLNWRGKPVVKYTDPYPGTDNALDILDCRWDPSTLRLVLSQINDKRRIWGFDILNLTRCVYILGSMIYSLNELEEVYCIAELLRTKERYMALFYSGANWFLCEDPNSDIQGGSPHAAPIFGYNEAEAWVSLDALVKDCIRSNQFQTVAAARIVPFDEGFPKEFSAEDYAGFFLEATKRFSQVS